MQGRGGGEGETGLQREVWEMREVGGEMEGGEMIRLGYGGERIGKTKKD